jgi:hypothetical protein
MLRPIRKLNTELIIAEWSNLLRIFVSLALKTTTQSIIVRTLNSYARRNKTQQALWEYDNISRSLYLLKYIDSVVSGVSNIGTESVSSHYIRYEDSRPYVFSAFEPAMSSSCCDVGWPMPTSDERSRTPSAAIRAADASATAPAARLSSTPPAASTYFIRQDIPSSCTRVHQPTR